jgi:hypothetical protein
MVTDIIRICTFALLDRRDGTTATSGVLAVV